MATNSEFILKINSAITEEEKRRKLDNFVSILAVCFTGVSAFVAAAVSIHNVSVQSQMSQDLEKVKKVLERRITAYADLYAAAMNYYRALAPLDTGDFSLICIEDAEAEMKRVEGLILYVSEPYADKWQQFWQKARYTKEKVHREVFTSEERKKFWDEEENVKVFGRYLKELENLARQQLT